MYKKDICEKEKQDLDFDMHPPGPELKRLAEELEKKLEAQ